MISIVNTAIQPKSIRILDANENDEGYDAYDAYDAYDGDEHDDGYDAYDGEDEDDEDEDEDDDDDDDDDDDGDGDGDGDGAGGGAGDGDGGDVDGDGDGDGNDRSHPLTVSHLAHLAQALLGCRFDCWLWYAFHLHGLFQTFSNLAAPDWWQGEMTDKQEVLQRKFKCYGQFSLEAKTREHVQFSYGHGKMLTYFSLFFIRNNITYITMFVVLSHFLSDLWNPIAEKRPAEVGNWGAGKQRAVDVFFTQIRG